MSRRWDCETYLICQPNLQNHERNYGITELEGQGVIWAVKHFRPYIYGHHCVVYTDHEALKSLLNTPQPSGKLARWGLALQKMDLEIRYWPEKRNANADALSRSPLAIAGCEESLPFQVIAALQTESSTKGKEEDAAIVDSTLAAEQCKDVELSELICYLESGVLPEDEKKAREFALTKSQYALIDGVLYFVERDKSLRVIPPEAYREKLFHGAHDGLYGGHLRENKVNGGLGKCYWWQGYVVIS